MGAAASVSVIIPTYNESRRIASCLDGLRRFSPPWEVIVVDGQSEDGTLAAARTFVREGVTVLRAPRGRGRQMNEGAAAASGETLLFLHADVTLPDDAPAWVERALRDEETVAGAFRTWTVGDSKGAPLALLLRLADLRSRYARLPYGDQALFVRAEAFRRVGGVPEISLMEDLALSRRLRQAGRIVTLPARVRVSGRRFLARPVASAVCMSLFPVLFRLGVPAPLLARLYGDPH